MSAIPCQDAQCGWRRAGWIFVLTCPLGWVPYCRAQPAQLYEDLLIFVSLGALVSSGLQEGSYPYASQRFLEEQVPGRWRWLPPTPLLHSVFGTLLWCFCLLPHLPNQFLCDVCCSIEDLEQNAVVNVPSCYLRLHEFLPFWWNQGQSPMLVFEVPPVLALL